MHFLRLAAVALVLCSVATGSAFAQTKAAEDVTALLREFIAGAGGAAARYLISSLPTT
jgi:hypothetical protein